METMDPAELEAAMAAAGAIIEELTKSGAFVFAGGRMPPSSAITVDNTGESPSTVNGPSGGRISMVPASSRAVFAMTKTLLG